MSKEGPKNSKLKRFHLFLPNGQDGENFGVGMDLKRGRRRRRTGNDRFSRCSGLGMTWVDTGQQQKQSENPKLNLGNTVLGKDKTSLGRRKVAYNVLLYNKIC